MQNPLFDLGDAAPPTPVVTPNTARPPKAPRRSVQAVPPTADDVALAAALPAAARLGCSSWSYPGWAGLVWSGEHSENVLAKHGLPAYAAHPLLRSVCIDRTFYSPLSAAQFALYAAQVPDDFRFVVKAPALVSDPMVRAEDGRGRQPNPTFLDAALATSQFIEPAVQGLGAKLGVLVFQISPLPAMTQHRIPQHVARLDAMLDALPAIATLRAQSPDVIIAVEVRDRQWLTPDFADVLRAHGVTYCLGLHAKMPPIEDQLPILRHLWPGPLVARWNLNPLHGAYGYEDAQRDYSPYDRIVDLDPHTRGWLAKVLNATVNAGWPAYVTVSNKSEGCAPLSVRGLAQEIVAQRNAVLAP